VISGSVETTGNRVRVTASLNDALTQRQMRSHQVTKSAEDAFQLQDELVKVVGDLLEVELPVSARGSTRASGSSEPGAEDFYLQGRGYLQSGDKSDYAISVFSKAIERDSSFARARAGLAEAYLQKYQIERDPAWLAKARDACRE